MNAQWPWARWVQGEDNFWEENGFGEDVTRPFLQDFEICNWPCD